MADLALKKKIEGSEMNYSALFRDEFCNSLYFALYEIVDEQEIERRNRFRFNAFLCDANLTRDSTRWAVEEEQLNSSTGFIIGEFGIHTTPLNPNDFDPSTTRNSMNSMIRRGVCSLLEIYVDEGLRNEVLRQNTGDQITIEERFLRIVESYAKECGSKYCVLGEDFRLERGLREKRGYKPFLPRADGDGYRFSIKTLPNS